MMKTKSSLPTLGAFDRRIISSANFTKSWACLYSEQNYGIAGTGRAMQPGSASFPAGASWVRSVKLAPTERECLDKPYGQWVSAKSPAPADFGDLNGDGHADLLSRDKAGRLWFGAGDYGGVYIGSGWNQMTALTRHGDFSGDGHEDLLARDGSGRLWIYPGNGKGWFGARKLIGTGWNQMTALVASGDMNSEGRDDLLARDSTGRLWIYPGDGHGQYGARKLIGTGWNQMTALVAPGDLNSDHHNDLLARDRSGKLWIYPGDGHGRYGARKLIGTGWNQMDSLLAVGDTDGDGRNDLHAFTNDTYVLDGYPGNLGVELRFAGTGHGTWRSPQTQPGNWTLLNGLF